MIGEDTQKTITQEPLNEASQREPVFVLGIFVFCLVALVWILMAVLSTTRSTQTAETKKSIASLDTQLSDPVVVQTLDLYTAVASVANHIKQIRSTRFLFLPVWTAVKESVPKDIQFTSVSVGEDGAFRISGVSNSLNSVAVFTKALQKQSVVKDVTPLSIDKQPSKNAFNFTLSIKATKPKASSGERS